MRHRMPFTHHHLILALHQPLENQLLIEVMPVVGIDGEIQRALTQFMHPNTIV